MREVRIKSLVILGPEDPDFKAIISPIEGRRLGRLLKRALWCATEALKEAGVQMPDAIITATDYGCIENSELFSQEQRPVHFMQSTHNTISSFLAIRLKCHGYNTTFSHYGNSFQSALDDAIMQISLGEADTALVGWFDERTVSIDASTLPGEERAIALVLSSVNNAG